jgi:hypothetical protein
MIEDVALFLLVGGLAVALYYGFHRWNSLAPAPDGLFSGEKLISGMRVMLKVDDSPRRGYGFACLTDFRLVWTPNVGGWRRWNAPEGSPYERPVIVELSQVRRVDVRFWLGGSRLIAAAPDVRLELAVEGRSFGSWERSIKANARYLLPDDQPVLRVRDRYSRQEVLAGSKEAAIFIVLFGLYLGARALEIAVDLGGGSLTETQLIGIVVAVVALVIAAVVWETRRY